METYNNAKEQKKKDGALFKYTQPRVSPLILLSVIIISCIFVVVHIVRHFPKLDESEKADLKIPFNIDDAKALGIVLGKYKERHYVEVLAGISTVYIFLQTFAIPGSLFLSILLGFLFDFYTAMICICTCSAVGASLCFAVSNYFGRRLVMRFFPEKVKQWTIQVDKHRSDIFSYMLFLRMTPFLPNWFINLTSPIIGVPLYPFVFGTFFGVAPPSFIAIQTGKTLYKMTSSSGALSMGSIVMLFAFSLLALLPVIFKRYFKAKLE